MSSLFPQRGRPRWLYGKEERLGHSSANHSSSRIDLLKQSGLMSLSSHRPRYRVSSISIRNDLFHRRNRLGRQWPHTSRFCVPHPFFSRGTIKNLYPIVGGGMIACVAGMFVDELEELLPPGVIGVGKQ